MIKIDQDACIKCFACVSVCPNGAIEEKDGGVYPTKKCTDCGDCIEACPASAINKG
ncbi:MAG: 4Fe-4S binding protein [archaeon]